MLYTIAIAICLSSVDVHDCDQISARRWVVAPEPAASVSGCMSMGLQYAASTQAVPTGSYAKVFCRAGNREWPRERAT